MGVATNVPIDVADVEDFASATWNATDLGIRTDELGLDRYLSEVGGHGEVGDGCHQGDGGTKVVEDTVGTRLGIRRSNDDQSGEEHQGTYSLAVT